MIFTVNKQYQAHVNEYSALTDKLQDSSAKTPQMNSPVGPWNPGIESQIPSELRPLATIFRAENVFTSVARADEMHDLTGLPIPELVAFRPERLALHELLIRVTA